MEWKDCNLEINSRYKRNPSGSINILPLLKKNKIRVLIYSGDTDAAVSELDTIESLKTLKYNVLEWWRPWFITMDQIGGYITVYDGLTLSTVRGAGHMVPQWRRESAYYMFSHFLHNQKF